MLVLVAAVVVDRFVILVFISTVGMVGLSGLPPEHKRMLQVISLPTEKVKAKVEVKEASGLPPEHKGV